MLGTATAAPPNGIGLPGPGPRPASEHPSTPPRRTLAPLTIDSAWDVASRCWMHKSDQQYLLGMFSWNFLLSAYSERWRSGFRSDADRDSEMMAITIPTGCRSLFGGSRNGDRHRRNRFVKPSS